MSEPDPATEPDPRGPVLLSEHDADLGRLFRAVLLDEALEVVDVPPGSDLVQQVREHSPALAIVDVLPYDADRFDVLDRLRTDEVARRVPVIVLSTDRQVAEEALASYNVRVALEKPFGLDELSEAVRANLAVPTLHARLPEGAAPATDLLAQAERLIALRARQILFRWIQRLRREEPWRSRSDLDLADLLDHTPIVVKALDVELHYEDPAAFFERHPDAVARAQQHALLRRRQGIPLDRVIREYALLREEIWNLLHGLGAQEQDVHEFARLERAVNATLDAIMGSTVRAYLEDDGEPPKAPDLP